MCVPKGKGPARQQHVTGDSGSPPAHSQSPRLPKNEAGPVPTARGAALCATVRPVLPR